MLVDFTHIPSDESYKSINTRQDRHMIDGELILEAI